MKYNDLIKEVKKYVALNFKEPVRNRDTGHLIEITPLGVAHSLKYDKYQVASGRNEDLLKLVKRLRRLVADSVLYKKEADKKHRIDIPAIYKYRITVNYFGKPETIEIVVREIVLDIKIKKTKKVFYNHKFVIEAIKKPRG